MLARACGLVLAILLLSASAANAAPRPDFGQALREADAIRTSDTTRFGSLVLELQAAEKGASPAERQYLQLLDAYRLLAAGEVPKSVGVLSNLLGQKDMEVGLRVRAGALLVNAYALSRDFTSGLKQIDRTTALLDKVEDKESRHQALLAAALLYNQVGQFGLGLHNAETVRQDNPSSRFLCLAAQLQTESSQGLGKNLPDEDYNKAIDLCQSIGEPIMANLARSYQAKEWFSEGKPSAAIALLEGHLKEVEATRYPYLIGEFNSLIAKFRLAIGDVATSERYANTAVKQGVGFANTAPLVAAYQVLYSIAEKQGKPSEALAYYKRYSELDKIYLDEVKTREMAYQLVQHETKAQAQQIELLNKQNQVLQLQQRVNEQKAQSQRLLILLLVVLAGSISYWAFKTKRVQMSLKRMAETDALTSICNRHHFTQQSAHTLAQAARAGEDVALLMFDLDHFKSINDRFGHDVGDWVLKKVSEHCRTFCRRVDHLGRIGGEEFAILLSGCDLRGATRVAEDCRVRIASIDTQPCGYRFLVTASFGVTASSLSGYDLAQLLSHADKALYRSKREGRNRVTTFDGDGRPWAQLQVMAADDDPFRRLIS